MIKFLLIWLILSIILSPFMGKILSINEEQYKVEDYDESG